MPVRIKHALLVAAVTFTWTFMSTELTFASGGLVGEIGHTLGTLNPGNPNTVVPIPSLFQGPDGNGSSSNIQQVVSPSIDDQGNVWSGTGSGGGRGAYVGPAKTRLGHIWEGLFFSVQEQVRYGSNTSSAAD